MGVTAQLSNSSHSNNSTSSSLSSSVISLLKMSWSWKGFWGDDPVYRFNCGPGFFQAGRSKAEERFWVNYVHDDGSYLKPLRSRLSSRASSIVSLPRTRNCSTQSEASFTSSARTRNSSAGSVRDQVIVTRVVSEFDTSTNTSEDEREMENLEEVEEVKGKEEDKMSSVTSVSCRCKEPERERFISRMV